MFLMFGKCKKNIIDGTTWEFARTGFWLTHVVGAAGLLYLGAKIAEKRR
jgi:hypothetical protein